MIQRLRRSTFGLVALVALGFAIITLAIGFLAARVTHEALEKQLDHRIEAETAALKTEAHEGGLPGIANAIRRREAARSIGSLDYLLIDAQGRPIAGMMRTTMPIKPGYEEFLAYRNSNEQGIAQALTTPVPGGMLIVAADRSNIGEIDQTLGALFVGTLAAMLIIGIGAASVIGIVTQRRLARIDMTAHAIINGDFDRRVARDGSGSEFDNLAATINLMLDRISGLIENLRQVSSDVAHDLRTPLTRLYNRLDKAVLAEGGTQQEEIEAARAEVSELLEIFAALLRIAEIEGMAERLPRSRFDLSALLEQMAETYQPDAEASGHILQTSLQPGIDILGDRRLLSQALSNLLDNALRHTPTGTMIKMTLEQKQDRVAIKIADNGPGVDEQDVPRLFQRFSRSERARSTPGHGLGLSLVSAIMSAHHGKVHARAHEGFIVEMSLPALPMLSQAQL